MVGEKKEEDIVGRLEALRKKVPPPTAEKAARKPTEPEEEDEGRRRLARIVGIFVILGVLIGIFLIGSNLFFDEHVETPPPFATTTPPMDEAQEQAKLAELATAKSDKIDEIRDAFAGLPQDYTAGRDRLTQDVKTSPTKEDVENIDYEIAALSSWRQFRTGEVDLKAAATGQVIALIGEKIVKDSGAIKSQIQILALSELKAMIIKETRSEFLPIRLPRDQITGGYANVDDRVNIHYRFFENINGTDFPRVKYLAKDGKVVEIMRAAGTISLSEAESQAQSGGGTEGKGNVTSISLGGTSFSITDGPYGASAGFRSLTKSSVYTVNLAEVQKAAAASKISEEELMKSLEKYGIRLTEIERETNIGDFSAEYLMLVEVTEDEAREVIRYLDKKANILITISKTTS
jgi:hypothetical protein